MYPSSDAFDVLNLLFLITFAIPGVTISANSPNITIVANNSISVNFSYPFNNII